MLFLLPEAIFDNFDRLLIDLELEFPASMLKFN